MRITLFTSNQPRHTALIESLSRIAERVYAIQECNTVLPGQVADFFQKSEVMQLYFQRVLEAERQVFGYPRFSGTNVSHLALKMGDLSLLDLEALRPALDSDIYVVFGASFIRGELCNFLVSRKALNIHMGVSPYYRGSSCNFWAAYDGRVDLVGATVHRLSTGLDSGPMLFHALPRPQAEEPFVLGMKAVQVAHQALVARLAQGDLSELEPVAQDRSLELRYTRNRDFDDQVANEYLERLDPPEMILEKLQARDLTALVRPYLA